MQLFALLIICSEASTNVFSFGSLCTDHTLMGLTDASSLHHNISRSWVCIYLAFTSWQMASKLFPFIFVQYLCPRRFLQSHQRTYLKQLQCFIIRRGMEEEVVIRQELYKAAIRSLSQMKRREQMSVGEKKYFILPLRSLVTAPILKATVSFQGRDMKSVLGEGEGGVVRGGRGAGEVLR